MAFETKTWEVVIKGKRVIWDQRNEAYMVSGLREYARAMNLTDIEVEVREVADQIPE